MLFWKNNVLSKHVVSMGKNHTLNIQKFCLFSLQIFMNNEIEASRQKDYE